MSWSQIPIQYPFISKGDDDSYIIKSLNKPKFNLTLKGTRPERNLLIARKKALGEVTTHEHVERLARITKKIQDAIKRADERIIAKRKPHPKLPSPDAKAYANADAKELRKYIQDFRTTLAAYPDIKQHSTATFHEMNIFYSDGVEDIKQSNDNDGKVSDSDAASDNESAEEMIVTIQNTSLQ